MKWFYNMRMAAKLIASFVLVALITGALGLAAYINIQLMEKKRY